VVRGDKLDEINNSSMKNSISISRICLSGFAFFAEEIDLKLSPVGINLILGPNEAGKSTLVAAIKAIIYGLRSTDINSLRPWSSRQEFKGELHLQSADGTGQCRKYIIERDFTTNKVIVTDITLETPVVLFNDQANPAAQQKNPGLSNYRAIINTELNFPEQDLFTATACVDQLKMETAVDEQMRHILTGSATADYSSVLTNLEEEYFDLTSEPYAEGVSRKTKDRVIEQTKAALQEKKTELAEAQQRSTELELKRKKQIQLHDNIESLTRDKDRKETEYKQLLECYEIDSKIKELSKRYEQLKSDLEKIEKTEHGLAECKTAIEQLQYAAPPPPDFAENLVKFEALSQEIENLEKAVKEAKVQPGAYKNKLRGPLIIGSSILFAAGCLVGWGVSSFIPALAAILLIAVCCVAGYLISKSKNAESQAKIDLLQNDLIHKTGTLHTMFDNMKRWLSADNSENVEIEGEKARHNRFRELSDKMKNTESILAELPDKENLSNALQETGRELWPKQDRLKIIIKDDPALKIFLDQPDNYARLGALKKDCDALTDELKNSTEEKIKIDAELEALQKYMGAGESSLAKEIEQIEHELQIYTEHAEAIGEALVTLHDSISEFQSVYKEALSEKISRRFIELTGNRYKQLRLDDDFSPAVDLSEQKDITAERLSKGTRDQLFFAMRLALSEALGKRGRLPLILDDPFVNFDDKRLAHAMETLRKTSRECQVILLSHDLRLKQFVPEAIYL